MFNKQSNPYLYWLIKPDLGVVYPDIFFFSFFATLILQYKIKRYIINKVSLKKPVLNLAVQLLCL